MTLNQAFEPLLEAFASMSAIDWNNVSATEVRAMKDRPAAVSAPVTMARVENMVLALGDRAIRVRLYAPQDAGEMPPLFLFFHGGGWVAGTLDTHDGCCRELARNSGAIVVSVDYRLAPEHPYPAALEDGFELLQLAAAADNPFGTDPARICVVGDSAGGNIAAAVALLAKQRKGPEIRHQLLFYPVTNDDFETASYRAFGGGAYLLSTASMQFSWRQYLGGRQADSLAAILRHENLGGLPPATVITAEYDPLRDEGEAYARRLGDAGVRVDLQRVPGMIHGFLNMTAMVPEAADRVRAIGQAVGETLRGERSSVGSGLHV